MNVCRAVVAVVFFLALICFETGCGDVYRPVATPQPTQTGNPSGTETEVVLSCCLNPSSLHSSSTHSSSMLDEIDVAGDVDVADKTLNTLTGSSTSTSTPSVPAPAPISFSGDRGTVFTANTKSDSVSAVTLSNSSSSFASTVTTIALESGAQPTSVGFELYGISYTQAFVVNSGTTATCKAAYSLQSGGKTTTGGSVSVISQASEAFKATVCLVPGAAPTLAWPYYDLSKVFVLDTTNSVIYVVNTSRYLVTNTIQLPSGSQPFKVAQSYNGRYLFVLNNGGGTGGSISIIDGQAEQLLNSMPFAVGTVSSAPAIDITQIYDTPAVNPNPQNNTQINHIWVLQSDGTVTVYDDTPAPIGSLNLLTTVQTMTQAQIAAGNTATNIALLRDGTYAYVGIGGTDQVVAIESSLLQSGGGASTGATTNITVGVHHGSSSSPATQSLSYTYKQVDANNNVIATLGPYAGTVPVEITTPTVVAVAVSRQGSSSSQSKAYAITTTNTTYYCYVPDFSGTSGGLLSLGCDDTTYGDVFSSGTTVVDSGTSATPPGACNGTSSGNSNTSSRCYNNYLPAPYCPISGQDATNCSVPLVTTVCSVAQAGQSTMSCSHLYDGVAVITAAEGQSYTNGGQTYPPQPVNSYVTTLPTPKLVTYCDPSSLNSGSYDAQKNCPVATPSAILGRN
jgi:hypothetical protein